MTNIKQPSLGIRNNNPGNIKRSNDPWQGLSDVQDDPKFFKFKTMAYGIRALARTLITYQDKYNIRTIKEVAQRYAPTTENDTVNYCMVVSEVSKTHENKILNFHTYEDLEPVIRGIIFIENGGANKKYITQDDIDEGLRMAGVPRVKPLVKSRTMQAATVAATGGAMQVVAEMANTLSPAVSLFERIAGYFPYLGAVLLLAGIGYIIYSKIKERKRY